MPEILAQNEPQTRHQDAPPRDALLRWAYWLNIILVLLAVPFSLFYLLLLTQSTNPPLTAVWPLVYAGIAMFHMACLLRETPQAAQFGLIAHAAIAATGTASLVGLFVSLTQNPQGGAFLPLVAMGGVISWVVWRSFLRRIRLLG